LPTLPLHRALPSDRPQPRESGLCGRGVAVNIGKLGWFYYVSVTKESFFK